MGKVLVWNLVCVVVLRRNKGLTWKRTCSVRSCGRVDVVFIVAGLRLGQLVGKDISSLGQVEWHGV